MVTPGHYCTCTYPLRALFPLRSILLFIYLCLFSYLSYKYLFSDNANVGALISVLLFPPLIDWLGLAHAIRRSKRSDSS